MLVVEAGEPNAQFILAQFRMTKFYPGIDYDQSVDLLRSSALQGHEGARRHVAYLFDCAERQWADPERSPQDCEFLTQLLSALKVGHSDDAILPRTQEHRAERTRQYSTALGASPGAFLEGQFELGRYMLKTSESRHVIAGINLIGDSANAGHTGAGALLLKLYTENSRELGTRRESSRCEIFANAGQPDACFDLSQSYFLGVEVQQDTKRAVELLHSAASKGHAKAQQRLAFLYTVGDGVAKDPEQAEYWRAMAGRTSLH